MQLRINKSQASGQCKAIHEKHQLHSKKRYTGIVYISESHTQKNNNAVYKPHLNRHK